MASPVLDDLIDAFLHQLDNDERRRVIKKLEKKNPNAAEVLKNVWKMEKRGQRAENLVDDILDALE